MKKVFIFICLSLYMFSATPKEKLEAFTKLNDSYSSYSSTVLSIYDKDKLLIKLGFNEKPEKELIELVDTVLRSISLDLISFNGYKSSMDLDYFQIKAILEKAIVMDRPLDDSEEYFFKYFYDDYFAFSKLYMEAAKTLSSSFEKSFAQEFMKYTLLKVNSKPYKVQIGIPKKDDIFSVEKTQNFVTTKDSSITLLYSFDPMPPMTYYIEFKLLSPDGIITKPEFPKIYKHEEMLPFGWFWNFEVVNDLKNKKGKWTVFLIINDKEVNQSSFILR